MDDFVSPFECSGCLAANRVGVVDPPGGGGGVWEVVAEASTSDVRAPEGVPQACLFVVSSSPSAEGCSGLVRVIFREPPLFVQGGARVFDSEGDPPDLDLTGRRDSRGALGLPLLSFPLGCFAGWRVTRDVAAAVRVVRWGDSIRPCPAIQFTISVASSRESPRLRAFISRCAAAMDSV